jgi:hypothetical protein
VFDAVRREVLLAYVALNGKDLIRLAPGRHWQSASGRGQERP